MIAIPIEDGGNHQSNPQSTVDDAIVSAVLHRQSRTRDSMELDP